MRERLNEEIKRRTRVVRIFPNAASGLRLVRALCADTHEGWLADHRSLHMEFPERTEERTAARRLTDHSLSPESAIAQLDVHTPSRSRGSAVRPPPNVRILLTLEGSGRPVAWVPPPHGPADDTPAGERRCPWRPGKREGHVSVEQHHVNQSGHQPRIPVGIGLLVLPRVSIHIHLPQPPDVSVCRNVDDVEAEAGPTPMEERVLLLGEAPLVFHARGAAVLSCGLISCLSIQRRPCSILDVPSRADGTVARPEPRRPGSIRTCPPSTPALIPETGVPRSPR